MAASSYQSVNLNGAHCEAQREPEPSPPSPKPKTTSKDDQNGNVIFGARNIKTPCAEDQDLCMGQSVGRGMAGVEIINMHRPWTCAAPTRASDLHGPGVPQHVSMLARYIEQDRSESPWDPIDEILVIPFHANGNTAELEQDAESCVAEWGSSISMVETRKK